jgi:hypothetical protein
VSLFAARSHIQAQEEGGQAMTRSLALMLLAVLGPSTKALAAEPQDTPPRFEIGGQIGLIALVGAGEGYPLVVVGPRLSIAVVDRVAIELLGELAAPTESDGLLGIYQIQIKTIVREGGPARSAIFVTAGTAGGFSYYRAPGYQLSRPDGSAIVYEEHVRASVGSPAALSGGVGMQRAFARHAAIRVEAQGLVGFGGGLIARGSVGISVPIGGRYVRSR